MNRRTRLGLLGTALVALIAISGCGGTNGNSGGLNGFLSSNGNGNNNNGGNGGNGGGGGGGGNQVPAPFLFVANAAGNSMAEFGIGGTGALTAVNFANNLNTIQTGITPACITSINLGNGKTAVYVGGTGNTIQEFVTDNTTGVVTANGATNSVAVAGNVNSMAIAVTQGLGGTAFLYALEPGVATGQIESFQVNADGTLAPTAAPSNATTVGLTNQAVELIAGNDLGTGNTFLYALSNAQVAAFQVSNAQIIQGGVTFQPGNPVPLIFNGAQNTTTIGIVGASTFSIGDLDGSGVMLIGNTTNSQITALTLGDGVDGTTGTGGGPALDGAPPIATINGSVVGTGVPSALFADGNIFAVTSEAAGNATGFSLSLANGAADAFGANSVVITPTNATTQNLAGNNPVGATIINNNGIPFLYVANTGNSTVAIFTMDPATGLVSPANGIINSVNTGLNAPANNPQSVNIGG